MKHPHHEVICAWLNGKEIQYRMRSTGQWIDAGAISEENAHWRKVAFYPEWEFRIKPQLFQVALIHDSIWDSSTARAILPAGKKPREGFIKWLSEPFDGE